MPAEQAASQTKDAIGRAFADEVIDVPTALCIRLHPFEESHNHWLFEMMCQQRADSDIEWLAV
jgi:hypothetical protein